MCCLQKTGLAVFSHAKISIALTPVTKGPMWKVPFEMTQAVIAIHVLTTVILLTYLNHLFIYSQQVTQT